MGALKLVEARSRRDDGIVVGVALFMLLAAALADQSLWRVPLYLLMVWGACAAMALIADRGGALAPRAALRLSARALAMAHAAGRRVFPVLSAIRRPVLGAAARRTGQPPACPMKCRRAASASSPIEYDPAFRVRFEGAAAAARGAVFPRPGAQRLRRIHLAPRRGEVLRRARSSRCWASRCVIA